MGHRTLSLNLIWRALALRGDAYDAMRDDDNPFMEGLFLIVLIAAGTALLALVGQLLAWASVPRLDDIRAAVLQNLLPYFQSQPWWSSASAGFMSTFQQYWDLGWRYFPLLFGAPNPLLAGLNIVIWPLLGLLGWLVYGLLAFLFARMLGGHGTLNQTLGTTALAAAPLLLRGLGVVPFLVVGSVLGIWQILCRYEAVRSAHRLPWNRAFWATLLPFAVYLLFLIVVAVVGVLAIGASLGR